MWHLTWFFDFFPLLPFSGELVQIMMATANENLSAKFCNRVLKFFTKLFQLSEWQLLIIFLGELWCPVNDCAYLLPECNYSRGMLTSGENSSEKVWKEVEGLLGAFPPSLAHGLGLLPPLALLHWPSPLALSPAEKSPNPSLLHLCGSLAQLACVEPARLQAWLTRMTASPPKDSDQLDVIQENRQLLQLLTTYIVRENR